MANILKIKRSDNANGNAPTALARGELAYHEVTDILYIGSGTETGGEAANQPVVAGPLNLMPAPTANVSLNSKKITNLATPTTANDAVTKAYCDATQTGLDVKGSVRVATTADLGGSWPNLGGSVSIDGVTLSTGDRVLVKDQSTASENGIYRYEQSGSADDFIRATDADNSPAGEVTSGMFTFVEEGSTHSNSGFVLSTTGSITLGSTSLAFSQFSGAGQITAGDGIQKSGNTLSVMLVPSGGLDFATHAGKQKITVNYSDANALGTLPTSKVTTEAIADGGANLATADQIHTFVTGSYAGDITSVSAGTGLGGGGTTGTVNLFVDLEEVANGASDPVGNDKLVYVTAGGDTKKYALSDVPLTSFDSATFIKDSSIIDCGTF